MLLQNHCRCYYFYQSNKVAWSQRTVGSGEEKKMLTVIEGEYMELLLCLPLEQMALGLKVEPLRWRETGGKEHRAGALAPATV